MVRSLLLPGFGIRICIKSSIALHLHFTLVCCCIHPHCSHRQVMGQLLHSHIKHTAPESTPLVPLVGKHPWAGQRCVTVYTFVSVDLFEKENRFSSRTKALCSFADRPVAGHAGARRHVLLTHVQLLQNSHPTAVVAAC
jgi:hypothetical protein